MRIFNVFMNRILVGILFIGSFLLINSGFLFAVPPAINIQGRLTDSKGVNREGNFSMVFTIYDQATGGTAKWSKTYSGTKVPVRNGTFQVSLGNPNGKDDSGVDLFSIFDGSNRWLGIQVEGTGGVLEPELVPRQQLVSVPHAFVADKLTTPTVPIGTILDWYRPSPTTPLPEGFQICDGGLISDTASPMSGQNTPNLTDKITYGVTAARVDSRETGGSNTINLQHSHTVNSHTHTLAHTHTFGGTTGNSNSSSQSLGGNAGTLLNPYPHDHNYSGTTSAPSTANSGPATPGTDSQLATTQDIRPAYVGVLKIIRIK